MSTPESVISRPSLHVRTWGPLDAQAVFLWHALGPFQSGAYVGEIAAGLAEEYGLRVFAPDAPGFGRSAALPAEAYRPSALADIAAEVLSAEVTGPVDWIGASWGGTIGCWFAERHRERLRRLVLLDVGYQEPLERRPLEQWIEERRFYDTLTWTEEEAASVRPVLAEAMRDSVRSRPDGSLRPIATSEVAGAVLWGVSVEPPGPEQLQGIPTLLLVSGDADPDLVARFCAAAPTVQTRPLPGTEHDLVGQLGPELVPIIGDWLTRP